MYQIKQSETTATRRRIPVLLVDITNGYTPETGVSSPTINISKNGDTTFSGTGTWAEIGNGQYYYEFTADEVDTLGWISINIEKATVSRDFNSVIHCVAYDAYAADKAYTNLTLAPDSTNQTIYLSVGATGIGFSASGISCHYTRDTSSPVGIGLTAQTSTGSWVSGGFVEVDSTNQPGIYRLDVPNAALSSGVNKTLVSFMGVSGVNGSYCNILLNYTRLPDVESRAFISGNTSAVEYINITQSNSGAPLTDCTYQSSGLTAYYIRPGGTPTAITLNSQTATGAFTSGGFVPVDNTNMPGLYRIDIPNAVFNSGVSKATVYLRGAGNMNSLRIEYK
jgi:hypothetical protein